MPFGPAPTPWRLKVKLMLSEESLKGAQAGEPFVVNQISAEPVGLSVHDSSVKFSSLSGLVT